MRQGRQERFKVEKEKGLSALMFASPEEAYPNRSRLLISTTLRVLISEALAFMNS